MRRFSANELDVYINGKFMAQRLSGVQRASACLLSRLDDSLADSPRDGARYVLLRPPQVALPPGCRMESEAVGPYWMPLFMWEQLILPWRARHGLLLNLGGAAPALARRQICTFHDAAVFDRPQAYRPLFVWWYRWLFRRLARKAQAVLTVSQYARSRLMAHLAIENERLTVIRNGADHLSEVHPDNSVLSVFGLDRAPYLLVVGAANVNKGLPLLLESYARMGIDRPKLVVVGGNDSHVFASASSGVLDDPPGLIRTGHVSDAQLCALYRHALALVWTSSYEGFGLPAVEAMALGCPVIATHSTATPEVCGDAVFYFQAEDAHALLQAMERVVSDAALREDLRRRGVERAKHFSWSDSATAIRCVIESPTCLI